MRHLSISSYHQSCREINSSRKSYGQSCLLNSARIRDSGQLIPDFFSTQQQAYPYIKMDAGPCSDFTGPTPTI